MPYIVRVKKAECGVIGGDKEDVDSLTKEQAK